MDPSVSDTVARTPGSDEQQEHDLRVLLLDASSSGRPTVTPASAGYSMRSRRIRC
jgi:hypothetical protein